MESRYYLVLVPETDMTANTIRRSASLIVAVNDPFRAASSTAPAVSRRTVVAYWKNDIVARDEADSPNGSMNAHRLWIFQYQNILESLRNGSRRTNG